MLHTRDSRRRATPPSHRPFVEFNRETGFLQNAIDDVVAQDAARCRRFVYGQSSGNPVAWPAIPPSSPMPDKTQAEPPRMTRFPAYFQAGSPHVKRMTHGMENLFVRKAFGPQISPISQMGIPPSYTTSKGLRVSCRPPLKSVSSAKSADKLSSSNREYRGSPSTAQPPGGRGWSASRSPGDFGPEDRGFAQSGSSPGHPIVKSAMALQLM